MGVGGQRQAPTTLLLVKVLSKGTQFRVKFFVGIKYYEFTKNTFASSP
jgi:hypothetical protein